MNLFYYITPHSRTDTSAEIFLSMLHRVKKLALFGGLNSQLPSIRLSHAFLTDLGELYRTELAVAAERLRREGP